MCYVDHKCKWYYTLYYGVGIFNWHVLSQSHSQGPTPPKARPQNIATGNSTSHVVAHSPHLEKLLYLGLSIFYCLPHGSHALGDPAGISEMYTVQGTGYNRPRRRSPLGVELGMVGTP